MNSVELENAFAVLEKANTKISFELTASEATDVRIALQTRIIQIWEMDNLDFEIKKVNADYYTSLYNKFVTE